MKYIKLYSNLALKAKQIKEERKGHLHTFHKHRNLIQHGFSGF